MMRYLLLSAILLSSCNSGPEIDMTIRAADVEGEWPLTVESVTVACGTNRLAVFAESNNRAYPLNGSANSNHGSYAGRYSIGDLKSIQKRDPSMAQYGDILIPASSVVEVALQRCKQLGLNDV